jgi:hypothetical protein
MSCKIKSTTNIIPQGVLPSLQLLRHKKKTRQLTRQGLTFWESIYLDGYFRTIADAGLQDFCGKRTEATDSSQEFQAEFSRNLAIIGDLTKEP